MNENESWLDELIEFYDFIWKCGVEAHGSCINTEVMKDFQEGGDRFEQMKTLILEKFPSAVAARIAFEEHKEKHQEA